MKDILSSMSAISDFQNRINSIANPPAMQAFNAAQKRMDFITNSPVMGVMQAQQNAIKAMSLPDSVLTRPLQDFSNTIAPVVGYAQSMQKSVASVVSAMQSAIAFAQMEQLNSIFANNAYLDSISAVNKALRSVAVFDAIPSLRKNLPFCFSYEHGEEKLFDEEIYPKLLDKEECSVELKETTLEVTFKVGDLEVTGRETRELVAIKQLFPKLEEKQIIGFISYLKKFPFLALSDEKGVGVKIFDTLKEKAINYTFIFEEGTLVYRARELSAEENAYFSDEKMLEPDNGIPSIGRFNPYGVSALYVSEDSETAKKELGKEEYQVAEIIVKKPLHILDLEKTGGLLYKYCNLQKTSKDYNPEEYMLSNFLSQCGCYLKIYCDVELDGFKYESTKNEGKYCYVLFEVHKPIILIKEISYEKSEIKKRG